MKSPIQLLSLIFITGFITACAGPQGCPGVALCPIPRTMTPEQHAAIEDAIKALPAGNAVGDILVPDWAQLILDSHRCAEGTP